MQLRLQAAEDPWRNLPIATKQKAPKKWIVVRIAAFNECLIHQTLFLGWHCSRTATRGISQKRNWWLENKLGVQGDVRSVGRILPHSRGGFHIQPKGRPAGFPPFDWWCQEKGIWMGDWLAGTFQERSDLFFFQGGEQSRTCRCPRGGKILLPQNASAARNGQRITCFGNTPPVQEVVWSSSWVKRGNPI